MHGWITEAPAHVGCGASFGWIAGDHLIASYSQRLADHRVLASVGSAGDACDSAHLLAVRPAREPWVIEPLRAAATRALATGVVESGVRYLRRGPRAALVTADLLVELGQAEAAVGDPQAPGRLRAALERLDDPLSRARRARPGRALSGQGRFIDAARAFQAGEDDARGTLSVAGDAGEKGSMPPPPTAAGVPRLLPPIRLRRRQKMASRI